MIARSIAARLTLIQQATAVLVVVTFAASALALTSRSLLNDETHLLRNVARRGVAEFDRELAEAGTIPEAARKMLVNEPPSRVQMRLYAPSGELLGATVEPAADDDDDSGRPASRAGQPRHEQSWKASSGVVVVASVATAARERTLQRLTLVMFWIGLPLMGFVYLAVGLLTRRALRPLETMTRRVAAIPSGAPKQGVAPLGGLAEIDALTGAFNELLTRLDDYLHAEQRFTAEASHELRTPLTALSGEVELALATPGLPPVARESLQHAAAQARAMHQLVEALLLLRRINDPASQADPGFEPVNLADILREGRPGLLRVYPGRESDLHLDLPDEVMVSGHPALLTSAVGNLLDNALKFTVPGQPVHVALSAMSGRAHLVVEDSGRGIHPDEARRVFDPFFRSPEARATTAGFGLGLPILKRVIQAHGGDVTLESAPTGGARFTLHLPLWGAARR